MSLLFLLDKVLRCHLVLCGMTLLTLLAREASCFRLVEGNNFLTMYVMTLPCRKRELSEQLLAW